MEIRAGSVHIQDVATMKSTMRQKQKTQTEEEQETAEAMTGVKTMALRMINFESSASRLTDLDRS